MRADVATAYDSRADEYIARFGSLEVMAPEDRQTIERWGAGVRGPVLDAGSGPGHWSDLLTSGGTRTVLGVDASTRFLASAHRRFTHPHFVAGDLAALPLRDCSVDGVLAWYSVIHATPADLPRVIGELARVLAPDGSLLLGYFEGDPGTPFRHGVTTAHFWSGEALADVLLRCGLVVDRDRSRTRHDPGARPHGEILAAREASA